MILLPATRSAPRARLGHARGLRRLAGLAGIVAAACGKTPAPGWIDVTASLEQAETTLVNAKHVLPGGRTLRLVERDHATCLDVPLVGEDWEREPGTRFWLAKTGLALTGGAILNASGFRLVAGTHEFPPASSWESTRVERKGFPAGSYQVTWQGVALHLAQDEKPPEQATLSLTLQETNGASAGRVLGRRYSGRGFPIWSGQRLRLPVDVPEASALSFATTFEPLIEPVEGVTPAPTTYRILQDGKPVFEFSVTDPNLAGQVWHRVPLASSSGQSELTFEVSGTLAVSCFLAPVIGPAAIGARGERPWDERRPDLLLFVADTFRADNMTAYGGTLGLTPNLDRFAAEHRLYRNTWAAGTYTLPSHVSMFTGVMPFQAGLRTIADALPEDMRTIAELLSAAGYRTGAVTDAGIVSRRFGFDQGFESFDEKQLGIESTVERALAFLDADDGRPAFLFVQSYRTHVPYEVSDETRGALGERLGIEGSAADLDRALAALAEQHGVVKAMEKYPPEFLRTPEAGAILEKMRAHYLGGVADLDRGFGTFLDGLEARDWLAHGTLLFTSDHGEAFGEHGELEHGEKVFESKIRIPLVLAGASVPPGVVAEAASQIDLAPTLAGLAGLPRLGEWGGQSLLALEGDRAVFSFGSDGDATLAVIEGSRKVIGTQADGRVEPDLLGAFDLARDPTELSDLRAEGWPAELLRRHASRVEQALVPVVESRAAELDASDLDELGKLGYGQH